MQKFDDEPSMEFDNINTAYNSIRNEFNRDLLIKWEEGKTGIPIIDACMRCLNETGYLNFRMRALVVSFFVHHLHCLLHDLRLKFFYLLLYLNQQVFRFHLFYQPIL